MPTHIHGKDSAVLFDGFDLTAYFNSVDTSANLETAETTAFGNSAKTYLPGLSDGSVSLAGMWDAGTGSSDAVLEDALAATTTPVVSIHMGGPAIGSSAIITRADEVDYSISSPIADVAQISASLTCTAENDTDQTLALSSSAVQLTTGAAAAVSGFPAAGASVDNAASSALGGMAVFHITQNSGNGTNYLCKVQHSANDSSWADLITFSVVEDAVLGSGFATCSGTVNRYTRAIISTTGGSSGTITYTVNFARF